MLPEIVIRPAHSSDAAEIASIHVRSRQQAYQGILAERSLTELSIAQREAYWATALLAGTPQVWVASFDESPIGWVAFGPCRDSDLESGSGEIWSIYLLPEYWSQGIGQRLMTQACVLLREQGFQIIRLWVLVKNQRARRFYENCGFRVEQGSLKLIRIADQLVEEVRMQRNADAGPV